ncbi:hypothetical protein V5799_005123 [Amblyomma americanum]|uniref:Uncharacterized protein n=1 Tax=Amblyomma americanum TaxID=6943 RepID=A0AAQ4E049_AMBAM
MRTRADTSCAAELPPEDLRGSKPTRVKVRGLKQPVHSADVPDIAVFVSAAEVTACFTRQACLESPMCTPLIGSMLCPFKRSLCELLGGWLGTTCDTLSPLASGAFCLSFQFAHMAAECACKAVLLYLEWFIVASFLVPSLCRIRHFLSATVTGKKPAASHQGSSKTKKNGTGAQLLK